MAKTSLIDKIQNRASGGSINFLSNSEGNVFINLTADDPLTDLTNIAFNAATLIKTEDVIGVSDSANISIQTGTVVSGTRGNVEITSENTQVIFPAANKKLSIIDWDEYNQNGVELESTDYGSNLLYSSYPDTTGPVTTLLLGVEDQQIRLINIPATSGIIKLIIERYPLETVSCTDDKIEGVPVNDRIKLLDWVKHKYYSRQDAETFDPDKAEASRIMFFSEMADVDAKDLKRTKKVGHTRYGGI